jgi:glycerophosphoryl diester phosphodiesterase
MMNSSILDQLPRVIGHRGASGHAPENTLSSIRMAADMDAKFIEIDVTLTSDDIPVIFHDSELSRCTNGNGPVLLKTLADLKKLDAGSWFSDEFKDERIPTLKEAISTIHDSGLGLNLEIKPCMGWQVPTADSVAKELGQYLPENLPLLISSFNIEALQVAGRALPDIPLGYLTVAIPPDWERRLTEAGCASLHCHMDFVTPDIVKKVRAAGFRFLVYTVNDVKTAQTFIDWGVNAVITDFPDRMLKQLKLD